MRHSYYLLLLALMLLAGPALAQPFTVNVSPAGPLRFCAGSSRTLTATATYAGLGGGAGFNDDVFAVGRQADGKFLLAGRFTSFAGTGRARAARLNADGTLDTGFNLTGTGLNAEVHCLVVQADGKVLLGGNFTSYNGVARGRIVRLNTDGSLDAAFTTGSTGFGSSVDAIVVQPDGKLLVGGDFNDYNGTARSHVARLNADGTLDASFGAAGTFTDGTVFTLARQADGRVLIGGIFTHVDGTNRPYVARLLSDGSLDTSFGPAGAGAAGAGIGTDVTKIAVQPDGQVLIAGTFTSYDGSGRGRVARLNTNGTLDTSFVPAGTGFDAKASGLEVLADGTVLVAGAFTNYNGVARPRIARLNDDGTLDTTFAPVGTGFDTAVQDMLALPDGTVLVGGSFTDYNGTAQGHVARLNASGTLLGGGAVPSVSYLWSNGLMTASIAVSTSGNYSVTATTTGAGGSSAASNVVAVSVGNAPTISGFSPSSGAVGTTLTITGTNLDNLLNAEVSAVALTGVVVNAGGTSLSGQVAAGTTSGTVSVTTDCGSAFSSNAFTVTGGGTGTAFQLLSTTPSYNALAVPAAGSFAATFNQGFDLSTAGALHLFSSQAGGHRTLAAAIVAGAAPNTVALTPSSAFRPGELVSFSATTAARSAGTGQALDWGQVRQFRVAAGVGPITLAASSSLALAGAATSPAVGDVNADGYPDLLMAMNSAPGTVQVRLGLAAGGFASTGVAVSVGEFPGVPVLADFDNDGDLDLATANLGTLSGKVSVRINTGGTLGGGLELVAGIHPYGLAVGDVDADGDLDLVVGDADAPATNAYLLRNTGGGNFAAAVPIAVGGNTNAVALADINLDGNLDLLAEHQVAGTVSYRLGTGTGSFGGGGEVLSSSGLQAMSVADFNGDSYPDLALAQSDHITSAGQLVVYLNTGTGGFGSGVGLGIGRNPGDLQAGDLDGDGDLDLVMGNRGTGTPNVPLVVFRNDGTGDFFVRAAPCAYAATYGLALADLDGDQDLDLVTANDSGTAVLWLNQSAPTSALTSFTPTSGTSGTSVVITGRNFLGATAVRFNGTAATAFVVNSPTQITTTVPAGATTGTVEVTTACGSVTSTSSFTITCPDLTVSSTQTIPGGCYHDLTITSTGNGTLGGDVTVSGTLTVATNAVLADGCHGLTVSTTTRIADGATLYVCAPQGIAASTVAGAWQLLGSVGISPAVNVVYNGTVPQMTGSALNGTNQVRSLTASNPAGLSLSGPLNITQTLTLTTAGNLNIGSQALYLLSDATGTALVVNTGTGVVTGTASVQRYISPISGFAGASYHHFSSPVSGNTVVDFRNGAVAPVVNPAYNSAAQPTNTTPFPTVFYYDQSRLATAANNLGLLDKGWTSPASISEALVLGRGYTVHIPASAGVVFGGTLHNGDYTLNFSRDNSPAVVAESGWQLVGNPYPAPLDYSLVAPADRLGLDAAIYVFAPTGAYTGGYRVYVNGVGGASPLLAMGQAFFTRVAAGQTTATLRYHNSHRITTFAQQAAFQRTQADTRPKLRLTLSNTTGASLSDDLYLYTENGATTGADAAFDAVKLPNTHGLNLSAVASGGEALAIQGLPVLSNNAVSVPLTVGLPAAGSYVLAVGELVNFAPGTAIRLHDGLLGTTTLLTPATRYTFSSGSTAVVRRFWLSLEPLVTALATQAGLLADGVMVYPNPATHTATVLVPGVVGAGELKLTLLNTLGQVVLNRTVALPAGGTAVPLAVGELARGIYTLRLMVGANAVTRKLVVE